MNNVDKHSFANQYRSKYIYAFKLLQPKLILPFIITHYFRNRQDHTIINVDSLIFLCLTHGCVKMRYHREKYIILFLCMLLDGVSVTSAKYCLYHMISEIHRIPYHYNYVYIRTYVYTSYRNCWELVFTLATDPITMMSSWARWRL